MKLSEALVLFLLEDRAVSTNETYRKVLRSAFSFLGPDRDVDQIVRDDILRYIAYLRERAVRYESHPRRQAERGGLSPRTVEKHARSLTTFFHWAVDNGCCAVSPATNLRLRRYQRPPGVTKAATQAEMQAIWCQAEAKAVTGNPKPLAIFLFLADTGCRAGEAANMQIGNLSLDDGSAWVLGKGDKLRPVFFGARTAEALRRWLAVHPKPVAEESVFEMTADSLSQVVARMAQRAGIERPIGAHAIRHAVANAWKLARINIEAIQLKMGHDDIVTTLKMYGNTEWDYVRHTSQELELAALEGQRPSAFTLKGPRVLPGKQKTG